MAFSRKESGTITETQFGLEGVERSLEAAFLLDAWRLFLASVAAEFVQLLLHARQCIVCRSVR